MQSKSNITVNAAMDKPLVSFFDAFGDPTKEQFQAAAQELIANSEPKFQACFEKLEEKITATNPLALLSIAAHLVLARPADNFDQTFSDEEYVYFANELELLQALVLQKQVSEFDPQFVHPESVLEILDLVKTLAQTNTFRRIASATNQELNKNSNYSGLVAEQFRLNTQNVRNDGYVKQMIRVYRELLAPIDDAFSKQFGVGCSQLVNSFEQILETCNERTNSFFQSFSMAFSATGNKAVSEFIDAAKLGDECAERVRRYVDEQRFDDKTLRLYLFAQMLNRLLFENIWRTQELSEILDASEEVTREIFSCFSLEAGELSNFQTDHLFLANPVWERPFIRMSDDQFFLMNSVHPISHCLRMIESLLAKSDELKEKYERRRGEFLELATYQCLQKALPDAQFYRGSLYGPPSSGENGENDLLVVWKGIALVIEAKAGQITDKAKRGHPERIERDVNKLLVDGASQAHRFIDFLSGQSGVIELETKSTSKSHLIDVDAIDQYVPLVVTFENGGSEYACWKKLRSAKLVPIDIPTTLNCSLWDLEIVCEILESSLEIMHFFCRRLAFESVVEYFGDEMDLLVTYLETGLNCPVELLDRPLQLMDVSSHLNAYFMFKENGRDVPKPKRKMTDWFQSMISKLGKNDSIEHREIRFALLDFPIAAQKQVEKAFREIELGVRNAKSKRAKEEAIVTGVDPLNATTGILFFALGKYFRDRPRQNAYTAVQDLAAQLFADSDLEQVFVVAKNIDDHAAYSFCAVLLKPVSS